jgi:hypothetical protein
MVQQQAPVSATWRRGLVLLPEVLPEMQYLPRKGRQIISVTGYCVAGESSKVPLTRAIYNSLDLAKGKTYAAA